MHRLLQFAARLTAVLVLLAGGASVVVGQEAVPGLVAAEALLDDPTALPGSGTPLTLGGASSDALREAIGRLDLRDATPGLHSVYVRFQDAAGAWSSLLAHTVYVTGASEGQPPPGGTNAVAGAEAFVDADPGKGVATPLTLLDLDPSNVFAVAGGAVDIASLPPGVHTLYVRFRDATGVWSAPLAQTFEATGTVPGGGGTSGSNTIAFAEAFIDDDPGEGAGTALSIADDDGGDVFAVARAMLDIAGLAPGVHTLNVRFRDATGVWSAPLVQTFYATGAPVGGGNAPGSNAIAGAEAFIGVDPGVGRATPLPVATDGALDGDVLEALRGTLALRDLQAGLHTVHVRFLDATGVWSSTLRQTLYLPSDGSALPAQSAGLNTITAAEVSFDDGAFLPLAAADGAFDDVIESVALTLAVADGYHVARIRFRDSRDAWSTDTRPGRGLPYDSDWDGLPDAWEREWFGNLDQDGLDDGDEDGFSNAEEFERGQNPLVADTGGEVTISGFVRDAAGQGLEGVALCVTGATALGCNARSDARGFFVFGAGSALATGSYRIEPRATSASGPYAFEPVARDIELAAAHVTGVDFVGTPVADETPPTTRLTAGPAPGATLTAREATFAWSGTDDRPGLLEYAYRLDGGPWSAFSSDTSVRLEALADGAHRFEVKARDAAGNEDATPVERSFTVDATPPAPASGFGAAVTAGGISLGWDHSPSGDVALYRLFWNAGEGEIDYSQPRATILYPTRAHVLTNLPGPGSYRFGLRAVDRAGNEERNVNVTAAVELRGVTLSLDVEADTYDRGQDIPVAGQVLDAAGGAVADTPVNIAVRSSSATRTFVAFTDAEGVYRYTFNPLASEAGAYTVEATVSGSGLTTTANGAFRILGLWLRPSTLALEMSMNTSRTVNLELRNVGDASLGWKRARC